MRKFGDKNFWIILVISILVLISLTVGVIFLTRKSSKIFYDEGYIINNTALKTDKYYFTKDTVYKEDVFENYIFQDKDNNKVTTSKDNFIHYLDDSLSFMKNGVILDLDNFNKNLVPYYNITDKSIIHYNNGNYYIETADKKLVFGNFLGRITDNKYIAVGNIKIKLSGNEEYVSGKYFELLFVENGVVKISNNEGSYQTLTEDTIIYIGEKIKINLGTKEVLYENDAILTLEEMTIDGNENIDIKEPDNKVKPFGNETKNENVEENNNIPNNSDADDQPNEDNPNSDSGETSTIIKDELMVNLISAEVDIDTFIANMQVIDSKNIIKGRLILNIYDVDHKKTVYTKELAKTPDLQSISVGSLSPETNYYITVKEDGTNNEYLSRNFRTENLNLVLKREMVTTDSLSYFLDLSEDENIKAARITISDGKDYNENQVVTNDGNMRAEFTGLNSNTIYNVTVDEIVFKNTSYSQIYTINTSDITLKEKPIIGLVKAEASDSGNIFELSMEKPIDKDNSITRYIYKIYERYDNGENNLVYTFSSNSLKKEILKVGTNNLQPNVDYTLKITTEYYDNYKTNEIDTGYSDIFYVKGRPSIEYIEGENDFNSIRGTINLKDDGCTVSIEGRNGCNGSNNIYIMYSTGRSPKERIDINFNRETLQYDLEIGGLVENSLYNFEVYANVDLHNNGGVMEAERIGSFTSYTKGMDAFTMENRWKQKPYTDIDNLISVTTQINSVSTGSSIIDKLNFFKIKLYDEENVEIGSYEVNNKINANNIKDNYYNKNFNITTKDFGINSFEELKAKTNGVLSKYYKIKVVDAFDDEYGTNKFTVYENTFKYITPAIVLLEDTATKPGLLVESIKNSQARDYELQGFEKNINISDDTTIGYRVTANNIDINKISEYFSDNAIKSINFYAYNNNNLIETKTIDFNNNGDNTVYFKVGDGTENDIVDTELRRGNKYTFRMNLVLNENGNDITYPSEMVKSNVMLPYKEEPKIRMYVDNSTEDTITYKYSIKDYDKALYKGEDGYKFYYKLKSSNEEYSITINNEANLETFTLSNMISNEAYNISYYRTNSKDNDPSLISLGDYYFDGYHEKNNEELDFRVEYQDFSNIVKLILTSSDEFLNRVSVYKLKLQSGDLKYEKFISEAQDCDDNKCIMIDYKDISEFKNKNVTVSLEAFYDTGLVGYSNGTRLGSYFKSLGLVDNDNMNKVGYVFQIDNTTLPGRYIYLKKNSSNKVQTATNDYPMGIMGFDLAFPTKVGQGYYLNLGSITNISLIGSETVDTTFTDYGSINLNNQFTFVERGIKFNNNIIFPKVLDRVDLLSNENTFKFTSITPKVTVGENTCNGKNCDLEPTINGAIMRVSLSVDEGSLENDFVKTDDKYKFYIDIFDENDTLVKTVLTDYDNLQNIEFIGLNPDTTYYYKIAADMNKNGQKTRTYLFNGSNKVTGYLEYKNSFKTLGSNDIYHDMSYSYNSYSTNDEYSNRVFNLKLELKNTKNYDIKYYIYNNDNTIKYAKTLDNSMIVTTSESRYVTDSFIMPNDFIFGNNSYKLVVYAVTKDLNKELVLYIDYLKEDKLNPRYLKLFKELDNAEVVINSNAIISDSNDFEINYDIVVRDVDRVIKDGIVNIELQDIGQKNACSNPDDCIIKVNLKDNICDSRDSSTSKIKSCDIISTQTGSSFTIKASYTKLNPDTNYLIYAYADTYRNNVSLSEKEGLVYARKGQYTKNELNFSLGSQILAFETENNNKILNLVFVSSSDVNKYIVGLEYSVFKEGATNIASNKIGKVIENNTVTDYGNLNYIKDENGISLRLPIDRDINNITGTISLAVTYYYYNSSNELTKLVINGNTVHSVYTKQ